MFLKMIMEMVRWDFFVCRVIDVVKNVMFCFKFCKNVLYRGNVKRKIKFVVCFVYVDNFKYIYVKVEMICKEK